LAYLARIQRERRKPQKEEKGGLHKETLRTNQTLIKKKENDENRKILE